ncbi:MAG: hypothetical protein RBS57_11875 [Desulforhabdus sp.]|jgi:hypothetical protein|nr:hypothetical protein [Desulforhabdus sp.]
MSIRLLAMELYRVIKEVERLEKKLLDSSLTQPARDKLADELRVARAERDRIKSIMEGAKAK